MYLEFTKIFVAQLSRINDQHLLSQISMAINKLENSLSLNDIPNLQEVEGFASKYVYKIGDYRIGLKLKDELLTDAKVLIFSAIFNIEDINKQKDSHKLFS